MSNNKILLLAVLLVLAVAAFVLVAGCAGTSTPTPTAAVNASAAGSPAAGQSAQPSGAPAGGLPGNATAPGGTPPGGMAGNGTAPGGAAPGSSTGSASYTLSGVLTVDGKTATETDRAITSTAADVSGVYVTGGGNLTLVNSTITKSGDSSSDDSSNFAGLNAGALATAGSTLTISGGTLETNASGANGVFSTGTGTTVYLKDLTIKTTKDSSRGVDVTYGGTIVGTNLTIDTKGAHCGAIASDRGEGTEFITGGTMATAGEGSPGIYCTGNFTVTDATLKATGSEAAVIEGKNTITLINTTLSGAVKRGVMIYQSYSGDAGVGTGTFTMTGGSLTAAQGPLFYVTNTNAVIKLTGALLNGASGTLLKASADSWGTSGSNGGTVTFTADSETLAGDLVADSISTISATLQNGTTLTGSVNSDHTAKAVDLTLDSTSKWNVTGDSYLTSLQDGDSTLANIADNGHTIYYDASSSANSWLGGKTVALSGGGKLTPK